MWGLTFHAEILDEKLILIGWKFDIKTCVNSFLSLDRTEDVSSGQAPDCLQVMGHAEFFYLSEEDICSELLRMPKVGILDRSYFLLSFSSHPTQKMPNNNCLTDGSGFLSSASLLTAHKLDEPPALSHLQETSQNVWHIPSFAFGVLENFSPRR